MGESTTQIRTNNKVIKVDKRYTIKFYYAGVEQKADFYEVKGELYNPTLFVNWAKVGETPDVSQCKTIDEVLEKIRAFSFGKRAEIELINGLPVFYYNKPKTQEHIRNIKTAYEAFVEAQTKIFFNNEIKPLLKKNKWKISSSHIGFLVLIAKYKTDRYGDKNESGKWEWDNVRETKKEKEFEFLCEEFLSSIGKDVDRMVISSFLSLLDTSDIDELYIKIE